MLTFDKTRSYNVQHDVTNNQFNTRTVRRTAKTQVGLSSALHCSLPDSAFHPPGRASLLVHPPPVNSANQIGNAAICGVISAATRASHGNGIQTQVSG